MLKSFGNFSLKQFLTLTLSGFLLVMIVVTVAGLSTIRDPNTQAATNTVTISVPSSADDGYVLNQGSSWPPPLLHVNTNNILVYTTKTLAGGTYALSNALIRFNTSSIPDNATITSASFIARVQYRCFDNNRSVTADWYNSWPIDSSDSTSTAQTTAISGVALSALTEGSDFSFPLNGVGNISKTGYTGLRFHINGGAPTGCNDVNFYTLDSSQPVPRIQITYNTPDPPPDTTPPSVPTGLTYTNRTTNSISLAWNASSDSVGVTGYYVYRNGAQVGSPGGTSFTDGGLSAGTNYSYHVRARDAAGNISGNSATLSVSTLNASDNTAPSVPGSLRMTDNSTTSISLAWNSSSDSGGSGLGGYRIFRNGAEIATTSSINFVNSGLSPGTSYNYFVRAFDNSGNVSGNSNTITVSTDNPTNGGGNPGGGSEDPPPQATSPSTPSGFGSRQLPPSSTPVNQNISGILNFLDLKLSLPYLTGKTRLLFVIGGFSYELDVSASQRDYKIDVRAANFQLGNEIELALGGQFLLIKKVKLNPTAETTNSDLGELPMGDLNNDNRINAQDKDILLRSVGRSNGGDITNDGVTNSFDWAVFLKYNGKSGD